MKQSKALLNPQAGSSQEFLARFSLPEKYRPFPMPRHANIYSRGRDIQLSDADRDLLQEVFSAEKLDRDGNSLPG